MNSLEKRIERCSMFLKLLKWDLKSQRKMFVLFGLYILSIFVLAFVTGLGQTINIKWIIGIATGLNFLLLVLMFMAPLVFLAINYSDDLYGKNAYTMHQIATKTSTILNAKIASGIIYSLVAFLIADIGIIVTNIIFNGYSSTRMVLSKLIHALDAFARIPHHITNLSAFSFWLIIIAFTLIGFFSAQIFYAIIVTLGNTKLLKKLGKGGMVISFLVIYLGLQFVSIVSMLYIPVTLYVQHVSDDLFRLFISFSNINSSYLSSFELPIIPIGALLFMSILSILGYIYIRYSLNNQKNI